MIAQEFDSQRDLPNESRTRVIHATEQDSFADQRTSERGSRLMNDPGSDPLGEEGGRWVLPRRPSRGQNGLFAIRSHFFGVPVAFLSPLKASYCLVILVKLSEKLSVGRSPPLLME